MTVGSKQLPSGANEHRSGLRSIGELASGFVFVSGAQRHFHGDQSHLGLLFTTAVGVAFAASHAECRSNEKDLESIKSAVHEIWLSVNEQLHRLDAAQPRAGTHLPSLPEPEVTITGNEVRVLFMVPQQLDIPSAVMQLRRGLSSPRLPPPRRPHAEGKDGNGALRSMAATTSEESSQGPDGRARRLRRISTAEGNVIVDILEPHDPAQPARFEFQGAALPSHLNILRSTMEAVGAPRGYSKHRRPTERFGALFDDDEPFESSDDIFESFPEFRNGLLAPFFSPLHEFLEELHEFHRQQGRLHSWGHLEEEDGLDGTGDGRSRGGRDFKRFDVPDSGCPEPDEGPWSSKQSQVAIRKLQSMGCQVFLPSQTSIRTNDQQFLRDQDHDTPSRKGAQVLPSTKIDWGQLAGYEEQKRTIEDVLLLPLVRPDVYDNVARGTREKFSSNRPRAVLFVGPPGTGKTSSARVIADQAAVPLCYIPLEALSSKWYGETERHLSDALAAADSLPEGCIVFLDELDALATSRGGEIHEATRRLLGVLLRHIDGFDSSKRSVVVGATNRPEDLDPALLSRFSTTVEFGLPGEKCRADILKKYAHQLNSTELGALATATAGMSGRDLRDICEQSEREWAAKIVRGKESEGKLPPLKLYLQSAKQRMRVMAHAGGDRTNRVHKESSQLL